MTGGFHTIVIDSVPTHINLLLQNSCMTAERFSELQGEKKDQYDMTFEIEGGIWLSF